MTQGVSESGESSTDVVEDSTIPNDAKQSEDVSVENSDIYPGPLIEDPERIKNLSSIELYYQIEKHYKRALAVVMDYSIGGYYQGDKEAFEKDFQEAVSAYTYCIYQTRKFGTDVVGPEEGKEFDWGIDFFKWEEFHRNFIYQIPSEERKLFEKAVETGVGIERFIPKEDWRDYKLSSQDMMRFKRMMSEES